MGQVHELMLDPAVSPPPAAGRVASSGEAVLRKQMEAVVDAIALQTGLSVGEVTGLLAGEE